MVVLRISMPLRRGGAYGRGTLLRFIERRSQGAVWKMSADADMNPVPGFAGET